MAQGSWWERARTVREGLGRPRWLSHPHARGGETAEVDPGGDAEAVEHPYEVFGGEVSGGALRVRAAAEAARGGVDGGHAVAQRGQGVGERLAVGVVEVDGEPLRAHARLAEGGQQGGDVAGGGHADGVAEAQLVTAEAEQPAG
ncbi:hypothetical protein GCM10020000_51590 [Streptomyces olivoverticillatus]